VKVEQANTESRPYEYADPRSLSQAWYDALYGPSVARPRARARDDAKLAAGTAQPDPDDAHASGAAGGRRSDSGDSLAQRALTRAERSIAGSTEREAAIADTRRRAAGPPEPAERRSERTDFDVTGPDGRTTRFLLRSGHDGLEVVAVTTPDTLEAVAEALTQVRIALAARGIRFAHEIRVKGRS
jgi:hypothetical protein